MFFGRKLFLIALAASPFACKSAAVPPQLTQAREVFERAERGRARELAPTHVYAARQALIRAEKSYKDDGADPRTLDLSYVALREAQQAEARGDIQFWKRMGEPAPVAMIQEQDETLEYAPPQVEGTNVTRTERGLVVSLQANVLFATGKSELLPTAKERLANVADYLAKSGQQIQVEGYTDSTGSDEINRTLSEARANAVREILVAHGVVAEKISAVGKGASNPIADNSSPEGRATNRRVEILVEPREG